MTWTEEERARVRDRYSGWGGCTDETFRALEAACGRFHAPTVIKILTDFKAENAAKRPNPNQVEARCKRYVEARSSGKAKDDAASCAWCEDAKGVDVLLAIVTVDDERLVGAEGLAAAGHIRPFGKSMAGEALLIVHPLTADEMQIVRRELFLRCGHCLPRGLGFTWTVERFMARFGLDFVQFQPWRNPDIHLRLIERILLADPPPPSPRMSLHEYLAAVSPAERERAQTVLWKTDSLC